MLNIIDQPSKALLSFESPFWGKEPELLISLEERVGVLRDGKGESQPQILEQYYNDVYKLFLKKLSVLDCTQKMFPSEKRKLQSLLNELLRIKEILSQKEE